MPEAEDKEQEQWSLVWYTLICAMKGAICRKNIIYWWPKGKLRKLGVFLSASVAFQGRGKLHSIIWGTGSRLKNTQILCPPLAASLQAELNSFQEMESFEGAVSTNSRGHFKFSCSWRKNHWALLIILNVHWGPVAGTSQESIQEGWQSITMTRTLKYLKETTQYLLFYKNCNSKMRSHRPAFLAAFSAAFSAVHSEDSWRHGPLHFSSQVHVCKTLVTNCKIVHIS